MPTRSLSSTLALLVLLFAVSPVSAQQPLFRSDLPLFTQADELWPRSFWGEESFGCESIMHFGDYVSLADGEYDQDEWWRFVNYGVMHCALIFYDASDRDWLNQADHSYAWLAPLGDATSPEGEALELFALQIGTWGGSQYLFLARPLERGANEWRLLDAECPRRAMRETDSLDIWGTAYCVIDSARTLRNMARTAVRRPPAAVFTWVGRAPDIEPFLPADVESFLRRTRECADLAGRTPSDPEQGQWIAETMVDFGCEALRPDGETLSLQHSDRPEIAALIDAVLAREGAAADISGTSEFR